LIIVLGKRVGNLQDIMTHIGYKGIDLHLTYSVENDRYTTMCDTYSKCSYELFSLLGSTIPNIEMPSGRISIPFNGIATIIRSTCLTGIQRSGCGAVIAYRLKRSGTWMWELLMLQIQPANDTFHIHRTL
jgi:hypothetical protein